jgi:hypothetical protein
MLVILSEAKDLCSLRNQQSAKVLGFAQDHKTIESNFMYLKELISQVGSR